MKSQKNRKLRSPVVWIVLGCVLLSLIIAGVVIGICLHQETNPPLSDDLPGSSDENGGDLPVENGGDLPGENGGDLPVDWLDS